MTDVRKRLLIEYYNTHRASLNGKILKVAILFLALSVIWNVFFIIFHFNYSRANLPILVVTAAITSCIFLITKIFSKYSFLNQQVVLLLVLFIICSLYIGSGYKESWGFFLFLPLIAGLYGENRILLFYSTLGLFCMLYVSLRFPQIPGIFDSIDISNRVLLYIILSTFSHLLHTQLRHQYNIQVNTVTDSLESTLEQVVNGFVISIEAKDSYTFGHSERVSKYAVELALKLPQYQDEKKVKTLRLTGLLHDVGKINIPESVLMKPGDLSHDEYELIKTHTIVGARMVEKISGLGSLKQGVLYHHEKWDGTGYPTGARGEQIPLDARILCIADAFDAMTSQRSYRSALSFNIAFERLKAGSYTLFDPNLIALLDDVQLAWLKIYRESNDENQEFERLTDFL
ncbi:HD-GYP domain-containing protein [Paenibacillus sp. GP183]|uniref:HD-GYP domain-containing protein n=1 Tax=Paenibacillus sp. GP183 TaxID=1882751 RepID=UPI000895EFAA|nr:HD-GYP domain-containing protein [Paenibacillus sp. GP183]SEB45913.1 HDIG domain-containing protein [Paenibacillus sp. GP183]